MFEIERGWMLGRNVCRWAAMYRASSRSARGEPRGSDGVLLEWMSQAIVEDVVRAIRHKSISTGGIASPSAVKSRASRREGSTGRTSPVV